MRWPSGRTNQDAYFARVGQWHTWYAWHPVLIDGRWVWLEHVERRGGRLYLSGWGTQWEHRCTAPGTDRFGGPHNIIGRRVCVVEMHGCPETWGKVLEIDVGRCERGLIYDGHQSKTLREHHRRLGQDTWVWVEFDITKDRAYLPLWWMFERGTHLEYQT